MKIEEIVERAVNSAVKESIEAWKQEIWEFVLKQREINKPYRDILFKILSMWGFRTTLLEDEDKKNETI